MIRIDALRNGLHLSADDSRRFHLQPKRCAILVYLAMSPMPRPRTRDELIAIFWPELAETSARRALRQAVHYLRSELGRDVLVTEGSDQVGLEAGRITCDAVEFDSALDRRNPAQGLQLYLGGFLTGFYFQDETAPFEAWVDRERMRLGQRALTAARDLSRMEERRGNLPGAAHWAQRAAELDPFGEGDLRRLMDLLWRLGDRAAAMAAFQGFAEKLFQEYGVPVAPETRRLAHAIESGASNGSPDEARARREEAVRRIGGEFERMTQLVRDLGDLANRGRLR